MLNEKDSSKPSESTQNVLIGSLIAGAIAGLFCDVSTFPLDTLKTRLQSEHGFKKSGGFKQLYQGVVPVIIGSAPNAASFFLTYEGIKELFQPRIPKQYHPIIHMTAASVGEAVACIIRVPIEVMKQRRQALIKDKQRLPLKTLYRGYGSTFMRDLPVGLIQLPLWEYFKLCWMKHVKRECTPMEGAVCGALSVAIAATATTPLDVAKTRIMLSKTSAQKEEIKTFVMLKTIYKQYGFKGLFSGYIPRVGGFTLSGFMFFGIYEEIRQICTSFLAL